MPSTMPGFRQIARRMRRAPTFALAVVLTFALGIGGAATVFAVVDGVLLRPLPYHRADRLVDITHTLEVSGLARVGQSDATYLGYRRHNRVFTDVGAYRVSSANLAGRPGTGDAGSPIRVADALATGSLFHVLGATSLRGRTIRDDDDASGAAPVAVIGQRLWNREFGGDAGIVGRHVMVDGVSRVIVGVMPASFGFPESTTDLWLPLPLDPAHVASAAFDYQAIGRLRDGVSVDAATLDLQRILPTVPEEFPGRLTAASIPAVHLRAAVRPLRDVVVGDVGRALWIVLAAVGVLLLIACANVANLFAARAEARQRELAVRRALGADGRAVLVEFLAEAAVLLAAGGALGIAAALAGVRLLQSSQAAASIPRLIDVRVDAAAFGLVAVVTAIGALVVSTVSVARARNVPVAVLLGSGGRAATSGDAALAGRRAMVIVQMALALILLIGAGLLARSFARLRHVEPGFAAGRAMTLRLTLPEATYPGGPDAARFLLRGVDAIASLPGVEAAGVSSKLPLSEQGRQDSAVFVEDHPVSGAGASMGGGVPDLHEIVFATPGYFRATGIPLVAGRMLSPPDPAGQPSTGAREVLASAAFARRYWPGVAPIGKRIRMNPSDPWSTIVGVVGDVHDVALDRPVDQIVYAPIVTDDVNGKPWAPHTVALVVRSAGDPAGITTPVERTISGLDPALPVYGVMPLSALLSAATARTAFTLFVLIAAAAIALGIGMIGIYGVIAYVVSLRTREIGVRLALGARPGRVGRMVMRRTLTDALVGVVLGLAAAVVLTRAMTAILFDTAAVDLPTFAIAAGLLLLTALAASWMPARRAAALDPAIALRAE